mmetsp:Transcript_972/g.2938  ORF Transcript_972/g.2938 Transcript_972/m.2938 type:complete len:95 (+) Transcript_972:107-391(+)
MGEGTSQRDVVPADTREAARAAATAGGGPPSGGGGGPAVGVVGGGVAVDAGASQGGVNCTWAGRTICQSRSPSVSLEESLEDSLLLDELDDELC